MAREKGQSYFLHLQVMAQCACRAGQIVQQSLAGAHTFHTANERLSAQQQSAQQERNVLLHELLHAFITPMERENLYQIAEALMALIHSLCAWGIALELLDARALRAVLARDVAQIQAVLEAMDRAMQALPGFAHPHRELSQRLSAMQRQLQLVQPRTQAALRRWAARPMDVQKLHLHALMQAMEQVYACAWHVHACVQSAVIQNT